MFVCVFVRLDLYPPLPVLSDSSTALLEERCSQEGRATSARLIFYQQGGFIGLINSLFVCLCCVYEKRSESEFDYVPLSNMCVFVWPVVDVSVRSVFTQAVGEPQSEG